MPAYLLVRTFEYMADRLSVYMSDRLTDYMSDRMPICQNIVRTILDRISK